jgi:hypothetical protein
MDTHLRRARICLSSEVHRALRLKAAATDRTISELVADAVRGSLKEDAVVFTAAGPPGSPRQATKDRKREGHA